MKPKGFTLIELLVVISIIALLSSVVLASLNSARDKGRIAAGRQFAASVEHSAGEQAVGIWDFDECSTSASADRSGYGNNITWVGSPPASTATQSGRGCAVSFDGSTQYGSIPNSASMQPLLGDWAVSFWIYRTGTGASDYPQVIGSRPWSGSVDKGWSVSLSTATNKMTAHYADGSTGWDVPSNQSASLVALNTWQQWVIVFDKANGKLSYYLDGKLDIQYTPTFPSTTINQTNLIYIGREFEAGNARRLAANLDDVRVYAKSLVASDVQRLYAESAPKFTASR